MKVRLHIIGTAAALALVGASVAQANNPARDDWFRDTQVSALAPASSQDGWLAAVKAEQARAAIYPDDRAVIRGSSSTALAPSVSVYSDDRAVLRGVGSNLSEPATVVGPTPAELRAYNLRSEGLNQFYGIGTLKVSDAIARNDRAHFSSKPVAPSVGIYPDDRPVLRGTEPTLVVATSSGFDWADAGIGAASGFGIALAIAGAALIVLRRMLRRSVGIHRTDPATAA